MGIRANVIIKDNNGELIFYRHNDGDPEGVAHSLRTFLEMVKDRKIRNNVEQAAGWLILLGCRELEKIRTIYPEHNTWKVGAYEPATGIAGDIEFLYEIDLNAKTLTGWEHDGEEKGAKISIPTK